MVLFGAAIFLGSFLLFQIQLLEARFILPWFGGAPAVWNSCILFFQTVLVAGYIYAHFLTRLKRRLQIGIHLFLLTLSLLVLPIIPAASWRPAAGEDPVVRIIQLLTATVGLPYLLLSASAPLLQSWYLSRFPGRSPWKLYALSNFASFLALLSYPFIVEPFSRLSSQGYLWGFGYAAYVLLTAALAVSLRAVPTSDKAVEPSDAASSFPSDQWQIKVMWFLLPACGSAVLIAVTNRLCLEVASTPFLWVLPLALYLATFIACFAKPGIYHRAGWAGVMLVTAAVVQVRMLSDKEFDWAELIVCLLLLASSCMVCHGELVRFRPFQDRKLTSYYISIAAGGAVGSAFVTLASPLLFKKVVELPIAVAAVLAALFAITFLFSQGLQGRAGRVLIAVALVAQLGYTLYYVGSDWESGIAQSRSFFGTVRVSETESAAGPVREMFHGTTLHGRQCLLPENSSFPTTYYAPATAVGIALGQFSLTSSHAEEVSNKRVGIVGLGVGTVASYGIAGDRYRFYEISHDVIRYANEHFTFLKDSSAQVDIVAGDGRISLEHELAQGQRQNFDVLIIDAFTSDAIPIHLLTREAVDLYLQHLKPNGLLLFNIPNRYFNLRPVILGHAADFGLHSAFLFTPNYMPATDTTLWAVLTRNATFLQLDEIKRLEQTEERPPVHWTDDFASLVPLMQ